MIEEPNLDESQAPTQQQVVPAPQAAPQPAPVQPGLDTAPAGPAPAAPANGAVKPTPREGGIKPMLDFFRDPERLQAAALIAAKAQRPDMLEWLKRGHEAQKENTGEALAKLAAGDKQGAIDMFNASGDMQAESIEDGSKKGTYKVNMKGGASREIDPHAELVSLLTPPKMVEHFDRQEVSDVRAQHYDQMSRARAETTAATRDRDNLKAQNDLLRIQNTAALQESQIARNNSQSGWFDERSRGGGGGRGRGNAGLDEDGNPIPKPLTEQQYSTRISAAAAAAGRKPDPITGKEGTPDPNDVLRVKSMAQALRNNPNYKGASPEELVDAAHEVIATARDKATASVEQDIKEAKKNKAHFYTSDAAAVEDRYGKPEKVWRNEEIKKRTDAAVKAATSPGSASVAGAAQPAPAQPAAAQQPAPFAEGARIRSKKDGKMYVVKNGVPVLDAQQ
jgi:hypothetical protein